MGKQTRDVFTTMPLYAITLAGLVMTVYGFLHDADLVTFMGLFLVIALFFVRLYIDETRHQSKPPVFYFALVGV